MTTVSDVSLGALQVIALLLPVVVVTMRLLLRVLKPTDDDLRGRRKKKEWMQEWVIFGSILSIALLLVSAVLMVAGMVTSYRMSMPLFFGFLTLLGGILTFGMPIMYVVYEQYRLEAFPSLSPPE